MTLVPRVLIMLVSLARVLSCVAQSTPNSVEPAATISTAKSGSTPARDDDADAAPVVELTRVQTIWKERLEALGPSNPEDRKSVV